MDQKPDKLPKSALSLYVKLYCKQKGGTNSKYYNNLIEATKSWLSLSEEEKRQFVDKLEECKVKFKHRFADYLKNVEPYLKKKPKQSASKESGKSQHDTNTHYTFNETIEDKLNNTAAELDQTDWIETFMETEAEYQEVITEEEQISEPLPEPFPPSIKSAEELFNIVQAKKNDNTKTWSTLTTREKQRYRNAVLSLKKDYIEKYKAYLESLSSKKLFDLYNKNLET